MNGEVTRCSGLWAGGTGTVLLIYAWNVGSPWPQPTRCPRNAGGHGGHRFHAYHPLLKGTHSC